MKTVADPRVLERLLERLSRLQPDSRRRWGSLSAHEVLCHLGDAGEMVLRTRPRSLPLQSVQRPARRWLLLWSPVRWPHGRPTNPAHNPRERGTRPTDWDTDLTRARAVTVSLAAAVPGTLEAAHGFFGTMSTSDWQRWAYRHTDHHLRQFGL